uniref:Immunoglobulin binding protein 1 n=1 Tax=Anolis carolinensis TaxID=28377 RepID=A0A803TWV9_ANOCA
MAAPEEDPEPLRLPELLERGWRLLEEAEGGAEGAGGPAELQRKVQAGIAALEQAQRGVEALELFSGNEELEEVASLDLRFLLVPALLGSLVLKQSPSKARLEQLGRARALFLRFLRQCKAYGLLGPRQRLPREEGEGEAEEQEEGEGEHGRPSSSSASDQATLLDMATLRREKIDRYKAKKDLEAQLEVLRPAVEEGRAEEEQVRHFYLLQIQRWVAISLEEVEAIDREKALLDRRGGLKQVGSRHTGGGGIEGEVGPLPLVVCLFMCPPPICPAGSVPRAPRSPPEAPRHEALHPHPGCGPGKGLRGWLPKPGHHDGGRLVRTAPEARGLAGSGPQAEALSRSGRGSAAGRGREGGGRGRGGRGGGGPAEGPAVGRLEGLAPAGLRQPEEHGLRRSPQRGHGRAGGGGALFPIAFSLGSCCRLPFCYLRSQIKCLALFVGPAVVSSCHISLSRKNQWQCGEASAPIVVSPVVACCCYYYVYL